MSRSGVLLGGAAALIGVAMLLLVVASPHRIALEEAGLNSDVHSLPETGETVVRPHETTEMIYAQQHPVYTRCAKKVDMPEFVKTIRKTCGNVHELTSLAAPCHEMLEEHAKDFGCCWETVMHAYTQLDPQAHHSWRMWQGTVSGKAGITFDADTCGDAMGEHDFHGLKEQVGKLQETVDAQEKDLQLVEGLLMMSMGFGMKGGAASSLARKLAASHAPFSAGDQTPQLARIYKELSQREGDATDTQRMRGRRAAQERHAASRKRSEASSAASPISSLFLSRASRGGKSDEGSQVMREAGIKV